MTTFVSAKAAAKSLAELRLSLRYELGLTYHQIAAEAKLCVMTVVCFAENVTGKPRQTTIDNLQAVVDALRISRSTQQILVAPRLKPPAIIYQRRRKPEPPKPWERAFHRRRDERSLNRIQA